MLVLLTGNGLHIGSDSVRRIFAIGLDAGVELPFFLHIDPGFIDSTRARRAQLLGAALTILVWAMRGMNGVPEEQRHRVSAARPVGSFEAWQVIRDAVLALGGRDVADRLAEAVINNPAR